MVTENENSNDDSNQNGSSGTDPNAGGSGQKNQDNKRQVSYETYTKTLDEAKAAKARLKALEESLNKVSDEKMKSDGDWKGLIEAREKRIQELEAHTQEVSTKYETLNERIVSSHKLSKVISKLGGGLDEKYFGLIDLNEVKVNPESGEIDDLSAAKVAESFRTMYPETIKPKGNTRMMGEVGSKGSGTQLTYEAWSKLTYQEQKTRYKDVIDK